MDKLAIHTSCCFWVCRSSYALNCLYNECTVVNCHVALSVLNIKLADVPNKYMYMELLPLQCSHALVERYRAIHVITHKIADLYDKSRDKVISLETDHSRQICKSKTKKISRKTNWCVHFCSIKFMSKNHHTHTHTHAK